MKRKINKNINSKKNKYHPFFYLIIFVVVFFSVDIVNYFINSNKNMNIVQFNDLSQQDKLDEFNFIVNLIEENYPYLDINEKYSNFKFDEEIVKYRDTLLDTKNIISYKKTLDSFIRKFNQPNFYLLNSDDYYLSLKYSSNNTNSPWHKVLNNKLSTSRYTEYKDNTIAKDISSGLSMEIIEENKTALIKINNFNSLTIEEDKKLIFDFIKSISNFKYLIIDIRGNEGFSIEYPIETLIKPLAKNTLVMNSIILQRNENHREFLDYYNNIDNINVDMEFFNTIEIENSHIDIDNLNLFPLYRKYNIRIEARTKNLFKGSIYILQDKNTSNGGDFLSQFSNITNFATTVGQFTTGKGVNLGVALIALPKSGLILSMPIGNGINEEGSSNTEFGTYPEIIVDKKYNILNKLKEMLN